VSVEGERRGCDSSGFAQDSEPELVGEVGEVEGEWVWLLEGVRGVQLGCASGWKWD
jgi:hypothetical protein